MPVRRRIQTPFAVMVSGLVGLEGRSSSELLLQPRRFSPGRPLALAREHDDVRAVEERQYHGVGHELGLPRA